MELESFLVLLAEIKFATLRRSHFISAISLHFTSYFGVVNLQLGLIYYKFTEVNKESSINFTHKNFSGLDAAHKSRKDGQIAYAM